MRPAGEHMLDPEGYDAELQRHDKVLHQALGVQLDDHVVDIGCGTGQTTRLVARLARAGSALGIDISAATIDRARALTRAAELRNATFEHADAQTYRFPQQRFDLAVSRFGTMFFADPVAAFTNIGQALRPGGRLVMMVWQAHEQNEWAAAIQQSLAPGEAPEPDGLDAFSFGDPPAVTQILRAAGFAGIAFTDVHEPVYYGLDVAAAFDWVHGFRSTREALNRLDPAAAARAVKRLRETLAAHLSDQGVWFDSRAWIVTAHRRDRALCGSVAARPPPSPGGGP
jgi:SAM-dependent methyltransferase